MRKEKLSFWQIWNMSFGFLGVQYAFGLQQANMSPIYRYLGAEEDKIPLLWLAGPITGLLIQPVIGAMSDATWHPRWGRRRPYFAIGAVLASVALILMPHSSSLWMAAGLLWILDSGANIAMEPFRAFIADKLPEEQRSTGFSMQSFFVGLGQTLANLMPFLLPILGITMVVGSATDNGIPNFVKLSFYTGAVAILVSIAITIFTTKENPPSPRELESIKANRTVRSNIMEIILAFKEMPAAMKRLWWVKFFTWIGLPLMWQYLSLSIARHGFNAPNPTDLGFDEGVKWGSMGLAIFNIACFAVSFLLPISCDRIGRKQTHALFLAIGGLGFITMLGSNNVYFTMGCMALVGCSWASIMAMPYVLLSTAVPPQRMGVYMGIFNMFIVIPQIISMVIVPVIYHPILGGDPRHALVLAGICLLAAAAACLRYKEDE